MNLTLLIIPQTSFDITTQPSMTTLTSGTLGLHHLSDTASRSNAKHLTSCIKVIPATTTESFNSEEECGKFQSFLEAAAMRFPFHKPDVPDGLIAACGSIVDTARKQIIKSKVMKFDTILPESTHVQSEWLDQETMHQAMSKGDFYVVGRLLDGT